jgi:hypothetical protein
MLGDVTQVRVTTQHVLECTGLAKIGQKVFQDPTLDRVSVQPSNRVGQKFYVECIVEFFPCCKPRRSYFSQARHWLSMVERCLEQRVHIEWHEGKRAAQDFSVDLAPYAWFSHKSNLEWKRRQFWQRTCILIRVSVP